MINHCLDIYVVVIVLMRYEIMSSQYDGFVFIIVIWGLFVFELFKQKNIYDKKKIKSIIINIL